MVLRVGARKEKRIHRTGLKERACSEPPKSRYRRARDASDTSFFLSISESFCLFNCLGTIRAAW